jgi:hypothetical protein
MLASVLLHWLVSQSIFLVSVEGYSDDGTGALSNDPNADYMACGYSPIAIIAVIVVGSLLLLIVLVLGFRRFQPGMPIAGSCSAVIAAACDPTGIANRRMAAGKMLQWGVTGYGADGIGHCSFSSEPVSELMPGIWYA